MVEGRSVGFSDLLMGIVPTSKGDLCLGIGHFRDERSESEKLSERPKVSRGYYSKLFYNKQDVKAHRLFSRPLRGGSSQSQTGQYKTKRKNSGEFSRGHRKRCFYVSPIYRAQSAKIDGWLTFCIVTKKMRSSREHFFVTSLNGTPNYEVIFNYDIDSLKLRE